MSEIHPAPKEFSDDQLSVDPILRFFHYSHLPEKLRGASKPFCDLAGHIVANAVSSAEVILYGLESLADRLFGARPEAAGKSGVENSDPGCALGRLHVLTSRLHDRLNRIDAVKNRLVDLA